jgi:hypothetical protein
MQGYFSLRATKYWLALSDLDQQRPADAADLIALLR